MEIVKIEKLPSSVNGWGFAGSTNKIRYIIENGDIWISGKACFRHNPPEKYIQARFKKNKDRTYDKNWSGGITNDLDEILRVNPIKYIDNFYDKLTKLKKQTDML